jgi:hypothetical protein
MLPYIERGEAGMVILAEDDSTGTYYWSEPVSRLDTHAPAGVSHVVLADGGVLAGWIADMTPVRPGTTARALSADGAALPSRHGDFEGAMTAVIDNHS